MSHLISLQIGIGRRRGKGKEGEEGGEGRERRERQVK